MFNVSINIAKIQKYNDGQSNINLHNDKIIDIDENTPIFILRIGTPRKCKLVHKNTNETIIIDVNDNSLLIISYEANKEWKHGIICDDSIYNESYSIVFRNSITYLHPSGYIFGKNTPFKTLDDLLKFTQNKENEFYDRNTQKEKIVEAYKKECKYISDIKFYDDIINNCIFPLVSLYTMLPI